MQKKTSGPSASQVKKKRKVRIHLSANEAYVGHVPNFINGMSYATQQALLEAKRKKKIDAVPEVSADKTNKVEDESNADDEDDALEAHELAIQTRREFLRRGVSVLTIALLAVGIVLYNGYDSTVTWWGIGAGRWLLLFTSLLSGRILVFPLLLLLTICFSGIESLSNLFLRDSWNLMHYFIMCNDEIRQIVHLTFIYSVWKIFFSFPHPYILTGERTIMCLLIVSIAFFLNRLLLELVRVTFHRSGYLGRLYEVLGHERFLVDLQSICNTIRRNTTKNAVNGGKGDNIKSDELSCTDSKPKSMKDYFINVPASLKHQVQRIRRRKNRVENTVGFKNLVKKCFHNCSNKFWKGVKRSWSKKRQGQRIRATSPLYAMSAAEFERASPVIIQRVVHHLRKHKLPQILLPAKLSKQDYESRSPFCESQKKAKQLGLLAFEVLFCANPTHAEPNCLTNEELTNLLGPRLAEDLYELASVDSNQALTKTLFKNLFVDIYKNRKTVALTLRDSDRVLSKLSVLSGFLFGAIALLVSLTMLDVEVFPVFATVGSAILGLAFTFGTTVRNLLEAFLLIFVARPFEVHDLIKLEDGKLFQVLSIGLHSTQLLRADGAMAYMPTFQLSQARIYNVTRGKNFWEDYVVFCDLKTDSKVYFDLTERLEALIHANKTDFEEFALMFDGIENSMKIKLKIRVKFGHNADNHYQLGYCRSQIFAVIRNVFIEWNVQYSMAPLELTSDAMAAKSSSLYVPRDNREV